MHTAKLAAALFLVVALFFAVSMVQAETVDCTAITALPAVITVQGVYCFTGNLATSITSGNAIDIQTNNVVLDLNGFKLGGLAAGPNTGAFGIFAGERQNITIRNGTIRGFLLGIFMRNFSGTSQGHVVEDIRADQNTQVGIYLQGSGNLARNNQVVATGGATNFAVGIQIVGDGARVIDNDVVNTVATLGTARGIYFFSPSAGGLAVNNRITTANTGIEFGPISTGKYRDNLTFDVTTPFTGGTDAGNNN